MIDANAYLMIRAASVYLAVTLTIAIYLWRPPTGRSVSAAGLAFVWNLPVLLALNLIAARLGWWTFDAQGGLLFGMPVDMYLAWAWLWGAVPALAFPSASLPVLSVLALILDLILMPAASPVIRLGSSWIVGDCLGLVAGLLPSQLLARWTARDEHLPARALLQTVAFSGLMLFVLPAVIIDGSKSLWLNPFSRPAWQISLFAQVMAVPAVIGLTAVHEFVTRGGGTPVPFDPPKRLVTSGVYSYVRNPMQLSAVLLLIVAGIVLRNAWISAAGAMAHVYSIGLAGWDEEEDLRRRFGAPWVTYRTAVRRWVPRLRPWHAPSAAPACLYVAAQCAMCSEVARWFHRRDSVGLVILSAEEHPSRALTRIRYETADGAVIENGVSALARALEHVHLGWAVVAFFLRLPLVSNLSQLLADASGAEPRLLRVPTKDLMVTDPGARER